MFAPPPLPPGLDPSLEVRGAHAHGFDSEDEDRDWPDMPYPAHLAAEHRWELRHGYKRTQQEWADLALIEHERVVSAMTGRPTPMVALAAGARLRQRARQAARVSEIMRARFSMDHRARRSPLRKPLAQRGRSRARRRGATRARRATAARAAPGDDAPPPRNPDSGSGIRTADTTSSIEVGRG